jgi:Gas vesicle synthesis protein GvpL/GvpF
MNDKQRNMWIYGVVPADASLEELGRRDRLPEVWIVESGDLGAIVGDAPEENARATRDQALAHARVLEAAVVDAPVVPFRFGTAVEGDDEAVGAELLEPYHDELARRLQTVKDVVQMTLKASYDEQAVLRHIIQREPELAELQKQTRNGPEAATQAAQAQLGELLFKAVELLREQDSAEIVERLKPLSVVATAEEIESDFMVLNVPFLVNRGRIEEFEEAVEQLANDHGGLIQFELLGPMPAYNFMDVERPAWA